ncbi:MAG: regulatory protein RecX [Acetivibrio ethanolgignens]
MRIISLEKGRGQKVYVNLEDSSRFLLYTGDIGRYHLEENMELSQELFSRIMEETLYRRARQKAVAVLKRADQSESELRRKLKQSEYPEEIIEKTIAYVYSYHYLNDERYAKNYIRYKSDTKSRRQIVNELRQKGVSKEVVDTVLEETAGDDTEAIRRAIRKKTSDVEALEYEQKQKLAAYLYRKGFMEEDIRRELKMR